jgi:hypothetical protein
MSSIELLLNQSNLAEDVNKKQVGFHFTIFQEGEIADRRFRHAQVATF